MSTSGAIMSKKELTPEMIKNKNTIGNKKDIDTYKEEYLLTGFGIYHFLGVNINGLTYFDKSDVEYSIDRGILTIKRIEIKETDEVTVLFNRLHSRGRNIRSKSFPVVMTADDNSIIGDYDSDPANYKEIYDISDYNPQSVIGINIDSIFYLHPNKIEFDNFEKTITLKSLKLQPDQQITLVINQNL